MLCSFLVLRSLPFCIFHHQFQSSKVDPYVMYVFRISYYALLVFIICYHLHPAATSAGQPTCYRLSSFPNYQRSALLIFIICRRLHSIPKLHDSSVRCSFPFNSQPLALSQLLNVSHFLFWLLSLPTPTDVSRTPFFICLWHSYVSAYLHPLPPLAIRLHSALLSLVCSITTYNSRFTLDTPL